MLIYILSPSFSGSTLLTVLLAQHPRIASIGELKATALGPIDNYWCSCGVRLLDCSFWRELQMVLAANGVELHFNDFDTHFKNGPGAVAKILGAGLRGRFFEGTRSMLMGWVPPVRRAWQDRMDRIHTVIDAIMTIQESDIFLDSSKDCIRLQHYVRAKRQDIKVIRIDRDGRGVVNSIKKNHRVDIDRAIYEWQYAIREQEHLWSALPDEDKLQLYYEDLCREPAVELARIETFLGIEGLGACEPARTVHLLGNQMRTANVLHITLDEKWRRDLTPAELAKFEVTAGSTNCNLGYSRL